MSGWTEKQMIDQTEKLLTPARVIVEQNRERPMTVAFIYGDLDGMGDEGRDIVPVVKADDTPDFPFSLIVQTGIMARLAPGVAIVREEEGLVRMVLQMRGNKGVTWTAPVSGEPGSERKLGEWTRSEEIEIDPELRLYKG